MAYLFEGESWREAIHRNRLTFSQSKSPAVIKKVKSNINTALLNLLDNRNFGEIREVLHTVANKRKISIAPETLKKLSDGVSNATMLGKNEHSAMIQALIEGITQNQSARAIKS